MRHGGPVGRLVAGRDDEADLLRPGVDRLVEDDLQRLLLDAVAIDEGLHGQRRWLRPAAVMTALLSFIAVHSNPKSSFRDSL